MADTLYGDLKSMVVKFVTMVVAIPVVVIGSWMQCVEDHHEASKRAGFESGDFCLVSLTEFNIEANRRLAEACKTRAAAAAPVLTFQYDDENHTVDDWVDLGGFRVGDLPPVSYVRRSKPRRGFTDTTNIYMPVYAYFHGPDAMDKTRAWLREHDYSNPNVELWAWKGGGNTVAHFERDGSEIHIIAYYERDGRLFMWDGATLHDCSAESSVKSQRDYVRALQALAK